MNVLHPAPAMLACLVLLVSGNVLAQTNNASTGDGTAAVKSSLEAPIYDSPTNTHRTLPTRYGSAEDDARPGEYFFGLAVQAIGKKDYSFAVSMYKVAASWAYKPAEYNLGVMYATGAGVQKDMPRAMAWVTLAAERNDRHYLAARNLINSKLSDAQFKQANLIFGQLIPTYGDATALVRAKARWAHVRASMTGSRVGSLAGNLKVGVIGSGMADPEAAANPFHVDQTAGDILGGNQTDGSVAYRQLVASNNPYDPKFERHPGSGTVTVKPLTPIKRSDADRAGKWDDNSTDDSHPI